MADFMDMGTYDEQENRALTLREWLLLYRMKSGQDLNPGTIRKRRAVANVGRLVPPKTYLLTKEEFETVLRTPLPMCNAVVEGIK